MTKIVTGRVMSDQPEGVPVTPIHDLRERDRMTAVMVGDATFQVGQSDDYNRGYTKGWSDAFGANFGEVVEEKAGAIPVLTIGDQEPRPSLLMKALRILRGKRATPA